VYEAQRIKYDDIEKKMGLSGIITFLLALSALIVALIALGRIEEVRNQDDDGLYFVRYTQDKKQQISKQVTILKPTKRQKYTREGYSEGKFLVPDQGYYTVTCSVGVNMAENQELIQLQTKKTEQTPSDRIEILASSSAMGAKKLYLTTRFTGMLEAGTVLSFELEVQPKDTDDTSFSGVTFENCTIEILANSIYVD